jgi:hypothetical protein
MYSFITIVTTNSGRRLGGLSFGIGVFAASSACAYIE